MLVSRAFERVDSQRELSAIDTDTAYPFGTARI